MLIENRPMMISILLTSVNLKCLAGKYIFYVNTSKSVANGIPEIF